MYVQHSGDVLLLSIGSIQRDLQWLLCEAQSVLAEEMNLHLVMENCEAEGNRHLAEGPFYTLDTLGV